MILERVKKIILNAIHTTQLDLTGLNILTEVGSNNFLYTPIIATLANAQQVFAWTKDTSFGNGEDVVRDCKKIMEYLQIEKDRIVFRVNDRPVEDISTANIITNLGMIRPITENFVQNIKLGTVIPYMCEAWELREGDIDIEACSNKKIKVAGTWENHPDLKIFDGCGVLSIKLAQEAGFEVYQNKICVISNDHFGEVSSSAFVKLGAEVDLLTSEKLHTVDFKMYDFIFLADYKSNNIYLGENGLLNNSNIPIVHLAGAVSYSYAEKNGYFLYPSTDGASKKMTRTLADLGSKPVIDLHTAGLKVGESLFRGNFCEYCQPINYTI